MAERKEFTKSDMEANRRDAYADGRLAGWEAGKKQGEAEGRLKTPLFSGSYDDGYKFGHKMGKIDGVGQTIIGLLVVVGVIFLGYVGWQGMEKSKRERKLRIEIAQAERMMREQRQCSDRWKGYNTVWLDEQGVCSVQIWPDSQAFIPEDKIHVGGEPPWKK